MKLCDEARKYGFATVCVNPANVALCARLLEGSGTKAIAVAGSRSARDGGQGVRGARGRARGSGRDRHGDQHRALKARNYASSNDDIREVVQASRPRPVKVILETGALTRDEKVIGCTLSKTAGAAFVKTSTGFGPAGRPPTTWR